MPMLVSSLPRTFRLVRLASLAVVASVALALPLAAALPVVAAEKGVAWSKAGSETFHDLPGVKPQSPDPLDDGYTCETGLAAPRNFNGRSLRDTLPYTVYRCEKDGIVYQGTEPPSHGRMWYPGVNPRNID
ncbi:hypothetical protein ASE36_07670 [Rhizobium sp. Root274]|uniref:hypothetical protein n=1 Tax=unclassified Rhizobium TaxID=2613769 RepID=UPI000715883A|nr:MULTISPECIES: hypothetical protein [unclassified Rhizobium]KQW32389.1 hypothetical protein ASC71_07680 [Rhizobium sp. Root1240]KRD33602.1 hypothetical protein ASE36_07670 [Rhizobium sp. Root274]